MKAKEKKLSEDNKELKKQIEFYEKGNFLEEKQDKLKKKRKRRKTHEILRNFKCMIPGCIKAYGSENSLQQHLRLKHSFKGMDENNALKVQAASLNETIFNIKNKHFLEISEQSSIRSNL